MAQPTRLSSFDMPRPRPKLSVMVAYALCPLLLAASAYGFWHWTEVPVEDRNVAGVTELFYMMCLIILPIVLFLFLSVTAAQRLEYQRLSTSYQARLDRLQRRLNEQEDFTRSVTDYNTESLSIFDKNNNFWFINHAASEQLKLQPQDILGKSAVKVLGFDKARKLEARLNAVRSSGKAVDALEQITSGHGVVNFIQYHLRPVDAFGDFSGGVLVREEDVTSLVVERERRESTLRQVISALVAVVDRRDPYASGHSDRVGRLARAIAEEMVLSESEINVAEIAGTLMNFGKVLVPRQILTKTMPLTADELARIRESMLASAEILSIIDFIDPVIPTLKQVLERVDGTGLPSGLKGEQIIITARIIAVANAFVALVSQRAHRPGIAVRDAISRLMADADKAFDRRVVAALAHYVENHTNKPEWLLSLTK